MKRSILLAGILTLITIATGIYATESEASSNYSSPTPTPKPSPTASPTASPNQTPLPVQTIADLQSKIRARLFDPLVRRGRVGIKIVSLNTGKVVFENDADKYFMPASNMKNFTVATALERLSPNFRFVTNIATSGNPDSNGTLKGDLKVIGRGDISMSTTFDPSFPTNVDHYRSIDAIVAKISAAGIKRIEGNIIGDESYFRGFALPESWEWDDLHTYYGTEISALPLNDNAIDISVKPMANGGPCAVSVIPATVLVKIVNNCTTEVGTDTLRITKSINQNVVEVSGSIPAGSKERRESISFTHVAELFVDVLKQRLIAKGIAVTGTAKVTDRPFEMPCPTCMSLMWTNIGQIESPPLSLIAAKTMKPSQNMYTETLLWTLGEQIGRKNGGSGNSADLGKGVVKKFLGEIGIPADGIVQWDGSGLSRHDLITPSAVVTLYEYMAKKSPYSQSWRDSLTIAGVDGTLRNRFKGTAAQGNMRGKTGTIDQVSALSGYVTTAGGEQLVISSVVNGVPSPGQRVALLDEIVVYLANFNGKIDQ